MGLDDIDLMELERVRHKLLMKKIEGLEYGGRWNLSCGMPLRDINDFKDACELRGRKYRDVVREFCQKYVAETNDIAERQAEQQAKYWSDQLKIIRTRKAEDMTLKQKVIEKAINEGVMAIEKMVTRGRYSQVVDRQEPVEYRQVAAIWSSIPVFLREIDKPDDVKYCMQALEQRLAKIKNKTVRMSAQDQLEVMKHRMLGKIYGELDLEAEDEKEKKIIDEQIKKVTSANI